jgi:predicted nucleic acid-binding Zn ribbon protein
MSLNVIGFLITYCRKNKLNCQVIMSYDRWNNSKSMLIVNDMILILMLLMIAIFSVDRLNQS